MKKTSKILAVVLSVLLCVCLTVLPAMAQSAEQDGLKLTLTADKESYAAGEQIVATVKVENTSAAAINGVSLNHERPVGYGVAAGAATKNVGSLAAGTSAELAVTYAVDESDDTGDIIAIIAAVAAVSGVALVVLGSKKSAALALALLLVCGIAAMGVPANADSASLKVSTTVKVDGKDLVLKASVSYEVKGDPVVYAGLKASQLDALPKGNFDTAMNVNWNFAWDGNPVAGKVDLTGTAAADSPVWRLKGEENHSFIDAGWGVGMLTTGAGSKAYMYAKTDVPETCTQFRIWAVGMGNMHWSGAGAFRAVALYKNADGNYEQTVLLPVEGNIPAGSGTYVNADGYVCFAGASANADLPGVADGMVIYNMDALKGKTDVVIVVETLGLGQTLGTADTAAAEGVAEGAVMPDIVLVRRVMFL